MLASSDEPVGTSIVTATDSPPPNGVYRFQCFGMRTCSRPSLHSTTVCSAALTSAAFAGLRGRTSTTVSVRSLAVIRASPTMSMITEMGVGVSKVGMVGSWAGEMSRRDEGMGVGVVGRR